MIDAIAVNGHSVFSTVLPGLEVPDHVKVPSLLTYLNPSHGTAQLRISLICQDPSHAEKLPYPFAVITDSDPLAVLIEAQFLTDAGSQVKRAFLLIQRDHYQFKKEELWPVHNKDIDASWQNAFSYYANSSKSDSLIILSKQMDERGKFIPFQSLFFCKIQRRFFSPPCPRCGNPIEQCDEDALLIHSGLQPYSTSLKRYLFCPSCFQEGISSFYGYELDRFDSPSVKDRVALIREFALLLERESLKDQFPCIECQDSRLCYGPDRRALSRIVPFSFYPFYMLVFEGMSLNALDFIFLISGAEIESLEDHLRQKGEVGRTDLLKRIKLDSQPEMPFLFKDQDKFFSEVLYLKLTFLEDLLRSLSFRESRNHHPDFRLSLENTWVKLADQSHLLPFLWNFKVRHIDIIRPGLETKSLLKLPLSEHLFFLGLLWFYTLLVNNKQSFSQVYLSLRGSLDQLASGHDFSFEVMLKEGSHTGFNPENIFWDPEGKKVQKKAFPLWEKSLLLGWSLLKASFRYDLRWSEEEFWKGLEDLRSEVKQNLFSNEPVQIPEVKANVNLSQDEAIHAILLRILKRWKMEMEAETEETKEMVIPPAEVVKKESTLSIQKENVKQIIPDTVIIAPLSTGPGLREKAFVKEQGEASPPLTTDEPLGGDFLAETVILGSTKHAPVFSQEAPPREDGMERRASESGEAKAGVIQRNKEEPSAEELAETVLLDKRKVREEEKNGKKR